MPADHVNASAQVVREMTDGRGREQTQRRGLRHRSISIHQLDLPRPPGRAIL
jgi:hypothetical protein